MTEVEKLGSPEWAHVNSSPSGKETEEVTESTKQVIESTKQALCGLKDQVAQIKENRSEEITAETKKNSEIS